VDSTLSFDDALSDRLPGDQALLGDQNTNTIHFVALGSSIFILHSRRQKLAFDLLTAHTLDSSIFRPL
jgi:hypothetical protein